MLRAIALLTAFAGLVACATSPTPTPDNVARGRAAVEVALTQPGADDALTVFIGGGRGERTVLGGSAINGDEVCGTITAETTPRYVSRQGMGVAVEGTNRVEHPAASQRPGCVALWRVVDAKAGVHPGLGGLRLN